MKTCSGCSETVEEYYHGRRCRKCYNEYHRLNMRKRYEETLALVRQYKVEQGCADCGWNEHHAGLEFDHREPRNGDYNLTIAKMTARGWNAVKKEIDKCDVVCGTHHNIRTWHRRLHGSILPAQAGEVSVFDFDRDTPCEYAWCGVGA